MHSNHRQKLLFEPAPEWAETSRPHQVAFRDVPSLLVINVPGDDCLEVASRTAANAIADPRSAVGRVFREHCGLLALPYVSSN